MNTVQKYLPIVLLLIAFSGGAVFTYLALYGGSTAPEHATVLPETMPLPDFSLVDHNGQVFDRTTLRGEWTLMFFGFTHCPDICPATLQQLAIARQRTEAAGNAFPRIVLVSVDPERDTPAVLAEYVAHFRADIVGVTGELDQVSALTRPLGIYFARSGDGEDYSVDHSAAILVFNPAGEWHSLFSAPHDVDTLVRDVQILMSSS